MCAEGGASSSLLLLPISPTTQSPEAVMDKEFVDYLQQQEKESLRMCVYDVHVSVHVCDPVLN